MDPKALIQKIAEWAVIAILAVGVGFLFGNSEATQMRAELNAAKVEIERLQRFDDSLKAKLQGRFLFMGNSVSIINFLCERDELCARRYDPLKVPE